MRQAELAQALSQTVLSLERERDEARSVAKRLMEAVDYRGYEREWGEFPGVLYDRHPWLKEGPKEPSPTDR